MLLIAAAYSYMNKADPDCGTSFTWVTRAMGPRLGWLTGWAIVAADVIVMATLAYIAGVYTFLLFGLDAAATNTLDISIAAAVWIAVMTWICWRGIELSARIQYFLLGMEIFVLGLFAVVALIQVYSGSAGLHAVHPALSWFSPFGIPGGSTALIDGVLLGVFIYWGWDSGVCVNEESDNSSNGPGRAAVMSTILLVLIYVVVSVSAQAWNGPNFLSNNSDDVLSALGGKVFGLPTGQAPDHRGPDLGVRVDPDHHPAYGQNDVVDGQVRGDPQGVRAHSSALPDPRRLHDHDGRGVAHLDPVHPQRQPERAQRLDHRARVPDRLLLRPDRVRLHDLLPEGDLQELPQLHHGRSCPVPRRTPSDGDLREGVHRLQDARARSSTTPAVSPGSGRRWRSGSAYWYSARW